MPTTLLAPVLAVLLALQPVAQAPVIPKPAGPLTLRGGEQPDSLLAVAQGYADRLGLRLVVDAATREALAATRVGLLADRTAPADEVHAAAQSAFALAGFAITGFEGGCTVIRRAGLPEPPFRPDDEPWPGALVEAANLTELGAHEALFVRTHMELTGLDARLLATSVRTLIRRDSPELWVRAIDGVTIELSGAASTVGVWRELLARATGAAPGAALRGDPSGSFPSVSGAGSPVGFAPDDSVLDVLRRGSAATGRALWVDRALQGRLAEEPCGLLAPLRCEAPRIDAFLEAVLANARLGLTVRGSGPRAIHGLVGWRNDSAARPVPLDLERGQLGLAREHRATLFAGVLRLEGTDARRLTTSLRSLLSERTTETVIALSDDTLFLSAVGGRIAELVDVLSPAAKGPSTRGETGVAFALPRAEADAFRISAQRESHLDLLQAYAHALGATLLVGPQERARLEGRGLGDLQAELLPGEFFPAVERALLGLGLGIACLAQDPPVLAVSGVAFAPLAAHRTVAESELTTLADRPALLVTVPCRVPGLDVRRAAMPLRFRLTNGALERLAVLDDETLLVEAPAAKAQELCTTLRSWRDAGEIPDTRGIPRVPQGR